MFSRFCHFLSDITSDKDKDKDKDKVQNLLYIWHIFEKQRVEGYQIRYSQRITRASYKDRDKDKDKDEVQKRLYTIFEKKRVQGYHN